MHNFILSLLLYLLEAEWLEMANQVQVDNFESGDVDDFIEHFDICPVKIKNLKLG